MKSIRKDKKLIGRIEKISFPIWGLFDLKAKVDTGAYTSSLHCHKIEYSDKKETVTFSVLDPSHPEYEQKNFTCPIADIRSIRSSNQFEEERVIIEAEVQFAGSDTKIELSLTDRSEMRYPVLIGRKFLRNHFIVDVSKKFIGE